MSALVSLESIQDAAERIRGYALRTPLIVSPWQGLSLKPESLQPVGSFKIRGAATAITRLAPEARQRGIVALSSGNHAQAVAYVARALGIPAHIFIPDNAPARKIEATRALGATVEVVPLEEAYSRPEEFSRQTGKTLIPPFENLDVIAGQGTIGLEIAADDPGISTILVPVAGGGLISGIAAVAAALLPNARVIGVEPELAADAAESLHTGALRAWAAEETARTIADGLRTASLGEMAWPHVKAYVHDILTVTEDEIQDATRRLAVEARLLAEPSGAVTTAAYLHRRRELPAGRAVAVVSGGNIDPTFLSGLVADAEKVPRNTPAGACP
ncbi:threonine/serine dehydratase [Streptomyces griseus]|uniref:threonine ammonia-lyase n=1 Tax=Streptomyces griseus TaxID=1911 RepID=UPI00068C4A5C|nr:threonine/serine dehydratase [Streptomyces griseus]